MKTIKASKFSDLQNTFVLKRGEERKPVAQIYRRAGISPATCFSLKKKYDGFLPFENARPQRLIPISHLTARRRQGAIWRTIRNLAGCATSFAGCAAIGRCRPGRLLGPSASPLRYQSGRADRARVERRIREICVTRVRHGSRRVDVLLRREDRKAAIGPNEVRALGFTHDQLRRRQPVTVSWRETPRHGGPVDHPERIRDHPTIVQRFRNLLPKAGQDKCRIALSSSGWSGSSCRCGRAVGRLRQPAPLPAHEGIESERQQATVLEHFVVG